jgi:hypothetical protein
MGLGMIGLIRKADNVLLAVVESTDGYDLADFVTAELPAGDPTSWAWDAASSSFVPRPPTAHEVSRAALEADVLWQRLEDSTPAQVEAWLAANMTDLASARRVVKFILLALTSLRARRAL